MHHCDLENFICDALISMFTCDGYIDGIIHLSLHIYIPSMPKHQHQPSWCMMMPSFVFVLSCLPFSVFTSILTELRHLDVDR
jgi:hypothetical protein